MKVNYEISDFFSDTTPPSSSTADARLVQLEDTVKELRCQIEGLQQADQRIVQLHSTVAELRGQVARLQQQLLEEKALRGAHLNKQQSGIDTLHSTMSKVLLLLTVTVMGGSKGYLSNFHPRDEPSWNEEGRQWYKDHIRKVVAGEYFNTQPLSKQFEDGRNAMRGFLEYCSEANVTVDYSFLL
jgi:TolA-binding protein